MREPHPMERIEEVWGRESEEVTIISLSVSVPVDVIVQSGDVSDMRRVTVKDRTRSDESERVTPNSPFVISHRTEDVIKRLLHMYCV